jgi:hypothetical protein
MGGRSTETLGEEMKHSVRHSVGAAVVAAATALATFAALPASASVSSKVPKACSLFTTAIATTALGGAVNPPKATKPNPNTTICKYTRSDGQAFGDVEVQPWIFMQQFGLIGKKTKISGLGDKAIDQGSPFGIAVKKGSVGFIVDLSLGVGEFNGAAADQLSAAETKAEIATARAILATMGKKKK